MNYTINWTDNTLKPSFTILSENFDSSTTSLSLIGSGALIWGEKLQENLLHLLENFASSGTPPANPTIGQLWFNNTTKELKVYHDGVWNNWSSSAVNYVSNAINSVPTTVSVKLNQSKSLEDFGAVSGSDCTVAFTRAIAYIALTGKRVRINEGTWRTSPFVMNITAYVLQGGFDGVSKRSSIIQRIGTGAGAFVTIGNPSNTVFQAGHYFNNLTIDGGPNTNGDTFVGYDLVRTCFDNVRFQGGNVACHLYGGISVTFKNPTMDLARIGFKAEKFTSLAGGGFPNLIRIDGGEIVDNSIRGIEFDHGQQLIVKETDIEGNGTTLGNSAHGGIWIGPNIGEAVFLSDNLVPGLIGIGLWVEANNGLSAVTLEYGINSLKDCEFFQQSTQVVNDINVIGGRYHLDNVNIGFSKTYNLLEGINVVTGNTIKGLDAGSFSFNDKKTALWIGDRFIVRGGELLAASGLIKPLLQSGIEASGTEVAITFPIAFKVGTTPKIWFGVSDSGSGLIDAPTYHTTSNTGFTLKKTSFNGTTIGLTNYGVSWFALGESD